MLRIHQKVDSGNQCPESCKSNVPRCTVDEMMFEPCSVFCGYYDIQNSQQPHLPACEEEGTRV